MTFNPRSRRLLQASIARYQPANEYYFEEGCFINELSNQPDDTSVSIARARVMPGTTTRWHRLIDIAERYVILSGVGEVEIQALPASKVKAGDVVLIPPMCAQRIRNCGTDDLVFLAVCTPRFRREAYEDMEPSSKPSSE